MKNRVREEKKIKNLSFIPETEEKIIFTNSQKYRANHENSDKKRNEPPLRFSNKRL